METPNLEIRTHERAPGIVLVQLAGEVDLGDTAVVETVLHDAIVRGHQVIVAVGRSPQSRQHRLEFAAWRSPRPSSRRVMDAIDFARLVPVFPGGACDRGADVRLARSARGGVSELSGRRFESHLSRGK